MFQNIMVPVDLAHMKTLEPTLAVVADMARHYDASITYVGITTGTPSSVARTPEEYEQKLKTFAQQRHSVHGRPVTARVFQSPDPIANMDDLLVDAVDDVAADLVIMATHLPKALDAFIPANGDKVAARASSSVFLVRAPQEK